MLRYFSILLLFLSIIPLYAQKQSFVSGQVMIMLQDNTGFEDFTRELYSNNRNVLIDNYKQLSKTIPIYLISSQSFEGDEKVWVSFIAKLSTVRFAQVNHYVTLRNTVPQDPRYSDQWQWNNTGTGNGKIGADVSAEKAWDITTGGLTAAGDTIVVCVIDDGIDLQHEDLAANIWYNNGEIPNNGIDDDGNGFVDDFNGWNFNTQNDNVSVGSHGVNVSGMIGAVGNNNMGVTGINWNIKIMNIVLSDFTEAAIVECYDYPYQSRLAYNNSHGDKGAFVVSVNMSNGIDYGNPDDAPIWCGFYDIMGEAGILNVAATSNQNINVDVDGDLPTGCTSQYLISVGRTDKNDNYAPCGYGPISIDLGAPGVNIVTTRSRNRYTTTTGTSFSSPLVAGLVGLMYSYPCDNIGQLMHDDYAAFALLVKDAILNGVDKISGYESKCLAGGRSNAYQSLQQMELLCAACQPGSVTSLDYTSGNAYIVQFNNGDNQQNIRFRPSGTDDWTIMENVVSPLHLELPIACTEYEFQMQTICPDDTSAWGFSKILKSAKCCESFDDLKIFVDSTGIVTIVNADLDQDVKSEIHYKIDGDATYTTTTVTGDTVRLSSLLPCTFYKIYVSVLCNNGNHVVSDSMRIFSACLSDCGPKVCVPTANAQQGFIDDFTINGTTASTGDNHGYIDYGDHLNLRAPDVGPFLNIVNINRKQSGTVRIRMFIDFDKDGIFSNGELFWEQSMQGNTKHLEYTHNFYNAIQPGTYKARLMMIFNPSEGPCEGGSGEVEDYCLTVFHVVPNECAAVETIRTISKSYTSIELGWDKPQDDVVAYVYRYKELPSGDYNYFSDTAHKIILKNLKECTNYEFGVFTLCQTDSSDYKVINFKTDCTNASNQLDHSIHWKVFPNPFGNKINVLLTSNTYNEGVLRLVDTKGHTVYHEKMSLSIGDHYINLDVDGNLPPGMYILTLTDGRGVKSAKLIKQ